VAAESPNRVSDALVVGRHQYTRDAARFLCPPIDVLDHRAARQQRKRLAWEARRLVSGRDDDDAGELRGMLGGTDREHDES
jgi:hypothetical protein